MECYSVGRERHDLYRWATDYLPADIQAAPAIGTIETLITLAVVAGCETVDLIDGFPVARSEYMQLSFREHPSLGPVAMVQKLPGSESSPTYVPLLHSHRLLTTCKEKRSVADWRSV